MNKIILIGNLTRDPELRTANTAAGPVSVCDFTIAVNDRSRRAPDGQENTTFFRVTAWRQLGENCSKFLSKGRKVYVSGPISARTYQANDGTTRVSLEVTADEVEFLSSRNEGAAPAPAAPAAPAAAAAPVPAQASGFTNAEMDADDLPF